MAVPQTFDEAFARVKELVNTFKENDAFYTGSAYQEAEARKDFIDKFWIALGWDINSEEETDPYKQRAKVERAVATSEFRKRADYAFYSSNFRDVQFFVEAKKPRVGLDNPLFYFQTIRYGWNSHVPISVLHDFEEMRVLDCRYKPDINTALGHAVLKYHYTEYANEQSFRTIYYLFSRQKVDDGSIQEYAKGLPKISRKRAARGVATDEHQSIDESFLQELDVFREELARGYKRKNPELDSAALTEVTQRTLDRLVFMRFLEDKLIESDQLIEDLHRKGNSWENFIATSRRLDRVYNGIIFKEHSLLDGPRFKADERVFDKISKSLSHRESPYDFNAIPIHILGSIYERFLGKVIVATAKQARIEDKPEVRKAGGVYYTPEYIVRYIVENTVGKLIEGKTPAQIQEMRFADIACGSGSFLLGVYDTLLRYHTAYYNRTKKNQQAGVKAGCIQKEDGTLQLSLLQKRQILVNNIHGVDIDTQAVEVAQLSLYLKLLEDETIASAKTQQRALHAALLPSLSKNIVCGNSLIGWDILEGKLFDSGEERKLNPMNFEDAFPEVMKQGGFDAIVGNPPYVRSIHLKESNPALWNLYRSRYKSGSSREWDIYLLFVERALQLVNQNGRSGYILPNKFLNSQVGENLRTIISSGRHLDEIVHFGAFQVFPHVTTYTCLLFLNKHETDRVLVARYVGPVNKSGPVALPNQTPSLWKSSRLAASELSGQPWNFSASQSAAMKKLQQLPSLQSVAEIFKGTGTNADRVYLLEYRGEKGNLIRVYSTETGKEYDLERYFLKPALRGRSVGRYEISSDGLVLLVPYEQVGGRYTLVSQSRLSDVAPNTFKYLLECKPRLDERENGRFKGSGWFCYGRPQNMDRFEVSNKIVLPDVANRGSGFLDEGRHWILDTAYALVLKSESKLDLRFVLGILNSPLLSHFLKHTGTALRGGYFRMKTAYLNPFPIPLIDLANQTVRARHDRIVQLVDQMLEAKKQLAAARTERDKAFFESKCATLDRQIDNLLYELYELTPEEIAIVEDSH